MKYITILLLAIAPALYAQTDEQQKAFAASYTNEQNQKYKEAIADLAAVYDATSYEINVRLGWLSFQAGDYPKSSEYYKKAIELMPYSVEAKLGYGLPLSALGNWNDFENIMKEILKTDPQNTLANYKLGLLNYNRAEYEPAKQYVEKVVNLYPFDYDSVVLLAWINLKMEDYRKAKVLFNKSLLIYPENVSALEGLKLIQ
jgi:tetratricopeptide (TPR) repeat protein